MQGHTALQGVKLSSGVHFARVVRHASVGSSFVAALHVYWHTVVILVGMGVEPCWGWSLAGGLINLNNS